MERILKILRDEGQSLQQTLKHIWWFMDGPNWLFVLFSVPLFGYVFLKGSWSATALIVAIFTAVYAFVVQNQMRESSITNTPTVRKDYDANSDQECDFGLRNFGPGPALYLRIYVRVVQEGSEGNESVVADKVVLREAEKPIHLREGGFISLIDENFPSLKPDNDHLKMKIYYSFTDGNGNGVPPNLNNHREIPFKEMARSTPDPRSISLETLRKQCREDC